LLTDPPTKNTICFSSSPQILSCGSVVGPKEGRGPLVDYFDAACRDELMGETSWEKAERRILMSAVDYCLNKARLQQEEIQAFVAGDLLNQIVTCGYTARQYDAPFIGIYGACSTFTEGLFLSSLLVDGQYRDLVLCATSSHHNSAERQFRYPTEFGAQRPPTSQWTITGAGACVISNKENDKGRNDRRLIVENATVGRVVDYNMANPLDLGSAMAPAAVDVIGSHFRDTGRSIDDYDLIMTGDLGRIGRSISVDLAKEYGLYLDDERYVDAGILIYEHTQNVDSGGSGCGCSAAVFAGYIWHMLQSGEMDRVLIVATGALMSPLISKQGETIPGVAHAVSVCAVD